MLAEELITKLEDWSIEAIQSEEEEEKEGRKMIKTSEICGKPSTIPKFTESEERDKGAEGIFEEIMI